MVRPFKREHFDLEGNPDMQIYYRRLTLDEFGKIKEAFTVNGRETILAAR
jgi:hypothetical protein